VRSPGLMMAVAWLCALAGIAGAQGEEPDFESMSVADLLNFQVTVASKREATTRESPGIVTVITREEIVSSGARELIDVLRLVPGFSFGVDVQGVVGVGMRGMWGHEGKILLLIDGLEMNENAYSTLQFGNHYPIEHIQRVEIIRGPGSAIYGGYAELAVINIITRSASDLEGVQTTATWGQTSEATMRRNLSASFGHSYGELALTAHALVGEGARSDRTYTDFFGSSYSMEDQSDLDPTHFNLGLKYRGFSARVIWDDYQTRERDVYDEIFEHAIDTDFETGIVDLAWEVQLANDIVLTPRYTYKEHRPWMSHDPIGIPVETYWEVELTRSTGGLSLSWTPGGSTSLLGGVEYYREDATFADFVPDDYNTFFNGQGSVDFDNVAAFAQAGFKLAGLNVTAGARWEDHSQFGSAFVPRLGVTRVFERFHFKVLYSEAFRAPAVFNINSNPDIRPEETTMLEVEAGYQLSNTTFLTANIFDLEIEDPIVYYFDVETEEEAYVNFEQTGTRGLELGLRAKAGWGNGDLTYSYYQANDNRVELYAVPGDDDRLLAMPTHKVTVSGGIKLGGGFKLGPSLVYLGTRYAYDSANEDEVERLAEFDATYLVNLFLSSKDWLAKGLGIGLGVYNLLDEEDQFLQPYNGWHAPLPGPSREYVLRLSYRFGW